MNSAGACTPPYTHAAFSSMNPAPTTLAIAPPRAYPVFGDTPSTWGRARVAHHRRSRMAIHRQLGVSHTSRRQRSVAIPRPSFRPRTQTTSRAGRLHPTSDVHSVRSRVPATASPPLQRRAPRMRTTRSCSSESPQTHPATSQPLRRCAPASQPRHSDETSTAPPRDRSSPRAPARTSPSGSHSAEIFTTVPPAVPHTLADLRPSTTTSKHVKRRRRQLCRRLFRRHHHRPRRMRRQLAQHQCRRHKLARPARLPLWAPRRPVEQNSSQASRRCAAAHTHKRGLTRGLGNTPSSLASRHGSRRPSRPQRTRKRFRRRSSYSAAECVLGGLRYGAIQRRATSAMPAAWKGATLHSDLAEGSGHLSAHTHTSTALVASKRHEPSLPKHREASIDHEHRVWPSNGPRSSPT